MKYIRTKDGIWEIMEIKPNYEKTYYRCKHNLISNRFEKMDIIKQADTIEELCDELMIRGEYGSYIIDVNGLDKDCDGWTKEVGIPKGLVKVYGAIWVIDDNGAPILKSVAKANKDGKLCLI